MFLKTWAWYHYTFCCVRIWDSVWEFGMLAILCPFFFLSFSPIKSTEIWVPSQCGHISTMYTKKQLNNDILSEDVAFAILF